jgi:hypothetical protein
VTSQWREDTKDTFNEGALERGWAMLVNEDFSMVALVNAHAVFDDIRSLHAFVMRCQDRMLRTKRHLCKLPFFQRLKEHSEVPMAHCMLGKAFMTAPLVAADNEQQQLQAFLACLPHCLMSSEQAPLQGGGSLMPVDSRSQADLLVKEWFALANRWDIFMTDEEFQGAVIKA